MVVISSLKNDVFVFISKGTIHGLFKSIHQEHRQYKGDFGSKSESKSIAKTGWAETAVAGAVTDSTVAAGTMVRSVAGTVTQTAVAAGTVAQSAVAAGTVTQPAVAAGTVTQSAVAAGTVA